MTIPPQFRRRNFGIVRVTGADARAFLHGQTTQDIAGLAENQVSLAAWLSPKGRVRALFYVVPCNDGFALLTAADNAAWLASQLAIYVLRADVQLEADPNWGLEATHDVDASVQNTLEIAAIAAGIPALPAALRELYIPQMLNLDRLNAISFTKGCYPGQEIVARTANLGSVKRRLQRFHCDGALPETGANIVDANGDTVGEVNRSAQGDHGIELLAVVPIASPPAPLSVGAGGSALKRIPLPYDRD